jgi:hypothetical protein
MAYAIVGPRSSLFTAKYLTELLSSQLHQGQRLIEGLTISPSSSVLLGGQRRQGHLHQPFVD